MKATRIYLIRHGEVDYKGQNINDGAIIGSLDIPLSTKGVAQMMKVGTALKRCRIQAIYTSTLKRSYDSGTIIAAQLDKATPIHRLLELNEADLGTWEGLTYSDIIKNHTTEFKEWSDHMVDFNGHGGESIQTVYKRVVKAFEKLINLNLNKNIAFVLHGLVNRLIIAHLLKMDMNNIFSIEQNRGSTNIIDIYPDGKGIVKAMNLSPDQLSQQQNIPFEKVHLVIGGAKSGKSNYALSLAADWQGKKVFIATARVEDEEMSERVKKHQEERGAEWVTYEEPLHIADVIHEHNNEKTLIVIDCLTLWLNNLLMAKETSKERDVIEEIEHLQKTLQNVNGPVILVSNEVGHGIVPDNALARYFRDVQGRLNQSVGQVADRITMLIAGSPLTIKG